ncbi:huntingtin-interacting protein 1-like isoform X2 [Anneissia japonica]|uniref:huntingtin-interacting protein 1-like isoform X2 n=1 Tax=Anneissia japonica TaxID=1529436 RepID=UPI0014258F9B|nr:huntingtin-interacting protein 1-like isoform X2 [Anneissia japonica]
MATVARKLRRSDTLETERQNFVKQQTTSITKAINNQEVPVKEKHVRNVIIGSFQEKGAGTFWTVVSRLPMQGNPIVCWKFCHTLHKLMREGHEHAVKDSMKHSEHISDLGSMWAHMQEGYSKLINAYCSLLVTKIEFHKKYPTIPGNLALSDIEKDLEKLTENEINNYFQLCVEIFDYLDALIATSDAIFGSFDLSKSISMTNSGQCRLSPLIPIIQDCSHLYDFSVRLMFKLHACLPADILDGHRDRFKKQFDSLKTCFLRVKNLMYFRRLIQVPTLPDSPPNFFVKTTDYSHHYTPAVVLQGGDMETETMSVASHESPPSPRDSTLMDDSNFQDLLVDVDALQQNGQFSSPPPRDDRDWLIDQLRQEISNLKFELERVKKDDQRIMDDMKKKLMELTRQLEEYRCIGRQMVDENRSMKQHLDEVLTNSENIGAVKDHAVKSENKAKIFEEKFNKMKEVYGKLREEHINLIRKNADVNKQLSTIAKTTEETEFAKRETEVLVQSLQKTVDERMSEEEQLRRKLERQRKQIFVAAMQEAEENLRRILVQMDDPQFSGSTCTAEYFLTRSENAQQSLLTLQNSYSDYCTDKDELESLVRSLSMFSNGIGEFLLLGKSTSHMAPLDLGEALANACRNGGQSCLDFLGVMRVESSVDNANRHQSKVNERLQAIILAAQELLPKEADIKAELGDIVDQEMQNTTEAIDKAASRIEEMLNNSRQADTGVKLEVNSRILDSCTDLMKSIKVLIEKSKSLQREIVSNDRGTASTKEFYKRHHRWTEGLISAAKLVGVGATQLVDSADKVMQRKGKFEELVVCSHEIAASTAQLVAASRVKAHKESENLKGLSTASKGVAQATASVVASSKSGAQLTEEGDVTDFTKMSLTQTKRNEMNSQVRVLELENLLEKERVKLAELRKRHYQLAGVSEGWEEDEDGKNFQTMLQQAKEEFL